MGQINYMRSKIWSNPKLLVYPITLLFTNTFRLLQAYLNTIYALVSSKGKIQDYGHFNGHKALNSLFYWNRALNIWRFGRSSSSPYLGLGDYSLARCFHYTLPSLYAFWKAAVPTLFICGNMWLLSFFLWNSVVDGNHVLIVTGVTAISTLYYSNVFNLQNYNLVGWMFFPLAIFAIQTGNWYVLAAACIGMSLGSFTGTILIAMLLVVVSILETSWYPILSGIPAGLLLSLNLIPLVKLSAKGASNVLVGVMKAIGMSSKKAVYVRKVKGKKLSIQEWYYLALLAQFIGVSWILNQGLDPYLIFAISIFIINAVILRFADMQSIHMMVLTIAVVHQINHFDWLLLASFWLLVSPIPTLSGYYYNTKVLDILPEAKPVLLSSIFADMDEFLEPISENEKVFMAFENPKGVYEAVFDGYRQLIELPAYRASVKKVLFLPEWWGVFELNYEGAPEIWGRTVNEVQRNMDYWMTDFVIVYQLANPVLEPEWNDAGFKLHKTFDWRKYSNLFEGHKYFNNLEISWFLLERSK